METILKLRVSTGKKKFFFGFDEQKDILVVETTERPQKGKANMEIVKELKKFFKANVEIVSGMTNRRKIIRVDIDPQQAKRLLENTN